MPVHSAFLKYFDEVCKSGSIRKAASKLFVASSAVNRQILKIEEELETKLFERTQSGIKLTETGKLLEQHIARTLADAERTFQQIDLCKQSSIQAVNIVGQESVISWFLPPALATLHAEFPAVASSFMAASGRNLNELLLNGSADIALAFDMQEENGIEQVCAIELAIGAVLSPKHPLATVASVTIEQCAEYSLILPDKSWPVRDILDRELKGINIDPHTLTTSNSVEFLRSMLGAEESVGFQTILGIESAVAEKSLLHIPLENKDGKPLTQNFSVCIDARCEKTPVIERILPLLESRLHHYQTNR